MVSSRVLCVHGVAPGQEQQLGGRNDAGMDSAPVVPGSMI